MTEKAVQDAEDQGKAYAEYVLLRERFEAASKALGKIPAFKLVVQADLKRLGKGRGVTKTNAKKPKAKTPKETKKKTDTKKKKKQESTSLKGLEFIGQVYKE
jgi:hypothetical protein